MKPKWILPAGSARPQHINRNKKPTAKTTGGRLVNHHRKPQIFSALSIRGPFWHRRCLLSCCQHGEVRSDRRRGGEVQLRLKKGVLAALNLQLRLNWNCQLRKILLESDDKLGHQLISFKHQTCCFIGV